jgi:hypothetical protein
VFGSKKIRNIFWRPPLLTQKLRQLEQLQQFDKSTWQKQEKLASNGLANQLGKNKNLAKLASPRAYMRARIVVAIGVSL